MQGALLGRMREGMQRASQYARDSFMLPPRQQQPSGTGIHCLLAGIVVGAGAAGMLRGK